MTAVVSLHMPGETEDKCTRQKTGTSFVLNVRMVCLMLQI